MVTVTLPAGKIGCSLRLRAGVAMSYEDAAESGPGELHGPDDEETGPQIQTVRRRGPDVNVEHRAKPETM
jgi:hypothetical protein